MKIKEIIVVEGKNDEHQIKRFFACDTFSVSGQGITEEMIETLTHLQKKRGLIILMDPDFAGEKIRSIINEQIPGCKNAFVDKNSAKIKGDIGVEHASKAALSLALNNLITYEQVENPMIELSDLLSLNLVGHPKAHDNRSYVARKLGIGQTNGKMFMKRLNMLQISPDELKEMVIDDD